MSSRNIPENKELTTQTFILSSKAFLPLEHSSVSLTPNVPKDAKRHNIPHPFQKELGFLLQHISKSHTNLSITHPTPNITKAKFHISAAISQWRSKLSTFSYYSGANYLHFPIILTHETPIHNHNIVF